MLCDYCCKYVHMLYVCAVCVDGWSKQNIHIKVYLHVTKSQPKRLGYRYGISMTTIAEKTTHLALNAQTTKNTTHTRVDFTVCNDLDA